MSRNGVIALLLMATVPSLADVISEMAGQKVCAGRCESRQSSRSLFNVTVKF